MDTGDYTDLIPSWLKRYLYECLNHGRWRKHRLDIIAFDAIALDQGNATTE